MIISTVLQSFMSIYRLKMFSVSVFAKFWGFFFLSQKCLNRIARKCKRKSLLCSCSQNIVRFVFIYTFSVHSRHRILSFPIIKKINKKNPILSENFYISFPRIISLHTLKIPLPLARFHEPVVACSPQGGGRMILSRIY